MIVNELSFARMIPVFITQPIAAIIFFLLAIRLILRKRDRITIHLFLQFLFYFLVCILNLVFVLLILFNITTSLYSLYFIMIYMTIFSQNFILLFVLNLLNLKIHKNLKLQVLIILVYGILILSIMLLIPNAISLDKNQNYRPIYSWWFLISAYILHFFLITLPVIINFYRIYSTLTISKLKKKFKKIIIGTLGILFIYYGFILFNTWQNQLFRTIWSISILIIVIPSAMLLYQGIGQKL